MKAFALEIRRTRSWYGAALVVAVSLWSGIVSLRVGVPLAGDATAGVTTATVYTTPLVAACFALSSSVRRANGLYIRSAGAARAGYSAYLPHIGALLVVLLIACGATIGLLQLALLGIGAWGALIISWLAVWVAALVLAGTIGYLIGLVPVPRVLAAPLAFAIVFGVWSAVSFLRSNRLIDYGAASLAPVMTNTTNPFVRYLNETPTGQVIFFLGFSVLLFATTAMSTSVRRRGLLLVVAGSVAACSLGATLVVANGGQVTTGHNSGNYACVESDFTLCLHPAYRLGADQLLESFARLEPRVSGTPLAFTRLEQNVAGVGEEVSPGAKSVYIEDFSDGYAALSIARYIQKYGGSANCTSYEGAAVESIVDSWLAGVPSWVSESNAPEAPIARAFEERPTDLNRDWLIHYYPGYAECSLTFDDLES